MYYLVNGSYRRKVLAGSTVVGGDHVPVCGLHIQKYAIDGQDIYECSYVCGGVLAL